jgi:hypothetical protein
MEPEQLILLVTASFASAVGFGDVYKCQVMHVMLGNLDDQEIMVTILAGDKVNSAFLSTHLETVAIEMGCKQRAMNEPYALMPISGFVDKNKTSWEIEYLKVSPVC